MQTLFVAWQDPDSRGWFPVGRLWLENGVYRFVYLKGVESAVACGFRLLAAFPQTHIIYSSAELFPLFRNRVMSRSRPDFSNYISRLNLPEGDPNPLDILSREARRATDPLEMFPMPELQDGRYRVHFPLRGMRYLPESAQQKALLLQVGDGLDAVLDAQNTNDSRAVLVRTPDYHILGFVPRFLAAELRPVLLSKPEAVEIAVEKVNAPPVPIQHRLLCSLMVESDSMRPYSGPDFTPLVQYPASQAIAS